jgi:hypothetical protein
LDEAFIDTSSVKKRLPSITIFSAVSCQFVSNVLARNACSIPKGVFHPAAATNINETNSMQTLQTKRQRNYAFLVPVVHLGPSKLKKGVL